MLDCLQHEGYGVKIQVTDTIYIIIPAFAFVDDVDLIQELYGSEADHLPQQIVSCWEESLNSTGGAPVSDISRFTIVKWKIQNQLIDRNISIWIEDDLGHMNAIEQIPNNDGELALGLKFSAPILLLTKNNSYMIKQQF
jgi:hypothetical protein